LSFGDLSFGHLSFGDLSFGHLSLGFPLFFLLNVLENQGNQTTNHLFHASTAVVQG
jgi:hypothetical protein